MAQPPQSQKPPPLLQPVFRKRLSTERRREISLVHHVNLDTIARGDASFESFLDFAGAVLAWSIVAARLHVGEAEIQAQLDLLARIVRRFDDTGAVVFEADDYQVAREGVIVMDLLAAEVDMATAGWAAERGMQEMNRRFVKGRMGEIRCL